GKLTRFSLTGAGQPLAYTRPDGINILGSRPDGTKARLVRYGLTGHQVKVIATGTGYDSAVYASNGATIAVSSPSGLVLASNAGAWARKSRVAGPSPTACSPERWWTSATILASCLTKGKNSLRLWLVPASGARPHALTPQRGSHSRDLGDLEAWQLRSGLYLQ